MQSPTQDRLIRELEALPVLAPPRDAEARVLAAMRAAADARGARYRSGIAVFAAAAGIAATAWLAWQLWPVPAEPIPVAATEMLENRSTLRDDAFAREQPTRGVGSPDNYVALAEQSALLERALFSLPAPRNVMRASTAGTIATLEDRIARIDAELTLASAAGAEPRYRTELWRERVDVMNALLQVRYANSQAFVF